MQGIGRYPDDEEFKDALTLSVNINYARALLFKIEENETSNILVPLNEVTIEHIMPQTLSEWWIEEHLKNKVDFYNSIPGSLIGYNCKKCLNRGNIAKIQDGKEVLIQCECVTSSGVSPKAIEKQPGMVKASDFLWNM